MYIYDLNDILFLIQSLQNSDPGFPVINYISFSNTSTRSGHHLKLIYPSFWTNLFIYSYFHRIVYLWNALLLLTFLFHYLQLNTKLRSSYCHIFSRTLIHESHIHFTLYTLVIYVLNYIILLITPFRVPVAFTGTPSALKYLFIITYYQYHYFISVL